MSNYDEASVLKVLEKVSRSLANVSTIKLLHHIFYRAAPVKGMGSGTIIDPEDQCMHAAKKELEEGRKEVDELTE